VSKITESARGQNCTVRLPGCSFDPATTVFAHISGVRFGHGTGIKTKLGAYACHKCHDLLDSRMPRPPGMTKQDVKLAHFEGMAETMLRLDEKGLINL
jgi:hypothetical protein